LRDAIRGHQLAYEAGVLHRDISDGNVMMGETPRQPGFITDFDNGFNWKSFMRARGWKDDLESWNRFIQCQEGVPSSDGDIALRDDSLYARHDQVKSFFKERTDSSYFVSIDLMEARQLDNFVVHEARHDLESFYWLLVWLVLRHTSHEHPEGAHACGNLFVGADGKTSFVQKRGWLEGLHLATVKGNRPLTALLRHLQVLCISNQRPGGRGAVLKPLTHQAMLTTFDDVLSLPGWPTSDAAVPFDMPRSIGEQPRSTPTITTLENGKMVISCRYTSLSESVSGTPQAVLSHRLPMSNKQQALIPADSKDGQVVQSGASGRNKPVAGSKRSRFNQENILHKLKKTKG